MIKQEEKPMSKIVSNKCQLTLLVDLLCKHPQIGKGLCSKAEAQKCFEEFAIELNKIGPPVREWHKWMRVWTDLKCKIKKKKIERHAVPCPPDEVRNPRIHLSELEEKVIQLLELDTLPIKISSDRESEYDESIVSGISSDETKYGPLDFEEEMMKYVTSEHAPNIEAIKSEPVSPVTIQSPKQSTTRQSIGNSSFEKDDYSKILEAQAAAQKEFYEKMTELMGDVRRSMNNIEDYIKSSVKQKNSLLELKKQKLKTYQSAKIQERIDARVKLKLQSELLEIKKKKQEFKSDPN